MTFNNAYDLLKNRKINWYLISQTFHYKKYNNKLINQLKAIKMYRGADWINFLINNIYYYIQNLHIK